jgi:hypothetical protein
MANFALKKKEEKDTEKEKRKKTKRMRGLYVYFLINTRRIFKSLNTVSLIMMSPSTHRVTMVVPFSSDGIRSIYKKKKKFHKIKLLVMFKTNLFPSTVNVAL